MKRGPGYWKFNNKLLHDKAYVELIKSEIEIIKAEEYKIENKTLFGTMLNVGYEQLQSHMP